MRHGEHNGTQPEQWAQRAHQTYRHLEPHSSMLVQFFLVDKRYLDYLPNLRFFCCLEMNVASCFYLKNWTRKTRFEYDFARGIVSCSPWECLMFQIFHVWCLKFYTQVLGICIWLIQFLVWETPKDLPSAPCAEMLVNVLPCKHHFATFEVNFGCSRSSFGEIFVSAAP